MPRTPRPLHLPNPLLEPACGTLHTCSCSWCEAHGAPTTAAGHNKPLRVAAPPTTTVYSKPGAQRKHAVQPHLIFQNLRRHVLWSTTHGVRPPLWRQPFGKPKVRELEVSIPPHQHILRLRARQGRRGRGMFLLLEGRPAGLSSLRGCIHLPLPSRHC